MRGRSLPSWCGRRGRERYNSAAAGFPSCSCCYPSLSATDNPEFLSLVPLVQKVVGATHDQI